MAQPEIVKDIDARVKIPGDTMTGNLTAPTFIGSLQGNASSADKLNTSAGSPRQPVYFGNSGQPILAANDYVFYDEISAGSLPNNTDLFVLKSGDVMTGNLTAPTFIATNSLAVGGGFIGGEKLSVNGNVLISNGNLSFNQGNAGLIYADSDTTTTCGGLVLCSSKDGWWGGASLVLRTVDSNNDMPGFFIIKAQKNKGGITISSDHFQLVGNATNGELSWEGNCFSVRGTGRLGPTGHTISTSGSIGCSEEIYAGKGFYGGNYHYHVNGDWRLIIGNHGNGNVEMNAATGGLYLGLNNTTAINFHTTVGSLGVMDSHTTLCSRVASVEPNNATLELREYNFEAEYGEHIASHAPRLGFHYGGRYWAQIAYFDNAFRLYDSALSGYVPLYGSSIYGAVWNDYAEFRSSDPIEPGRVICETGNGTLKLSTERLQPGANVVSDTFGFAIGETENCKTPIAVSGRALVYTYEDRYSYAAGDPVCAGPGGTVSKMSREEVMMYPDRIVGTVSEIPEYERWGTGNVEVKNRIWIKVK